MNKDENKSLISNQFPLKNYFDPFKFLPPQIVLQKVWGGSFDWFCPIYRLSKKHIGGPGWLNEFGNNIAYSLRLLKFLF